METFVPTKANYIAMRGKKAKFKKRIVLVTFATTSSKGGSWERGFRFYESEWAALKSANGEISVDHGKTWHRYERDAIRLSKGKMRLSTDNHGEFAFEGIQDICRQYEGPGYRWHR